MTLAIPHMAECLDLNESILSWQFAGEIAEADKVYRRRSHDALEELRLASTGVWLQTAFFLCFSLEPFTRIVSAYVWLPRLNLPTACVRTDY